MTELYIENQQTEIEITDEIKKVLQDAVDKVLESEECNFDAEVSITIVDEEEIKNLNREHRDKDAVTDVLSFPILEFDEDGNIIDSEFDFDEEYVVMGDIVLCAKRALEQSEQYGHSFIREMAFLTVHSMLHLLGYDHEDDEEMQKVMFDKQEKILTEMGITRD